MRLPRTQEGLSTGLTVAQAPARQQIPVVYNMQKLIFQTKLQAVA